MEGSIKYFEFFIRHLKTAGATENQLEVVKLMSGGILLGMENVAAEIIKSGKAKELPFSENLIAFALVAVLYAEVMSIADSNDAPESLIKHGEALKILGELERKKLKEKGEKTLDKKGEHPWLSELLNKIKK